MCKEMVKIDDILEGKHIQMAEEISKKIFFKKKESEAITSTKLRKLFVLVSEMYKKSEKDSTKNLNYLKMKICYEIGRDDKVEDFDKEARLVKLIEKIIEKYENEELAQKINYFYEYMEAFVAYQKFYSISG